MGREGEGREGGREKERERGGGDVCVRERGGGLGRLECSAKARGCMPHVNLTSKKEGDEQAGGR